MGEYTEQQFDYSAGRKNAPELVIMVGISGSGKSTVAKGWVNWGRGTIVRLNRDSLRIMLYVDVPWNKNLENLTRDVQKHAATLAFQRGKDVIIDDTNVNLNVRQKWEEFAKENRVRFRIVTMTTDIGTCIERDSKREGKERVGEGVIRKQYRDLNSASVVPKAYGLTTASRAASDREAFCTGEFTRRLKNAPFVICDVDGTLAGHEGIRSPFDESKVRLDRCHTVVADWVRALYPHYNILIMSGRHAGCCEDTMEWLKEHKIPWDFILMRSDGDSRSDAVIKPELLADFLTTVHKDEIEFVLDDRPRVIRAWKAAGLKVYPVAGTTDHDPACAFDRKKGYRRCLECWALEDF